MQDESNAAIRDKKKERNQNSKAYSENWRLSQSVREMIRAKTVEEARRACEEQVLAGCCPSPHTGNLSRAVEHLQAPVVCCACAPLQSLVVHSGRDMQCRLLA